MVVVVAVVVAVVVVVAVIAIVAAVIFVVVIFVVVVSFQTTQWVVTNAMHDYFCHSVQTPTRTMRRKLLKLGKYVFEQQRYVFCQAVVVEMSRECSHRFRVKCSIFNRVDENVVVAVVVDVVAVAAGFVDTAALPDGCWCCSSSSCCCC